MLRGIPYRSLLTSRSGILGRMRGGLARRLMEPFRRLGLTWSLVLTVVVGAVATQLIVGASPDLGSGRVSEQIGDLLSFCLVCGVCAFATIEAIKRLTSVRGRTQLAVARAWLEYRLPRSPQDLYVVFGRRTDAAERNGLSLVALYQLGDAMGIESLRVPSMAIENSWVPHEGIVRSGLEQVFNLQTEQLLAQVSRASDRALADSPRFSVLLAGLMNEIPRSLREASPEGLDGEPTREATFHDSQRVAAGVDQLQIELGESWRRRVQGTAVWMSGAYGLGLAWAVGVSDAALLYYELAALLIGGLLAWIARDLYSVIERLRRG